MSSIDGVLLAQTSSHPSIQTSLVSKASGDMRPTHSLEDTSDQQGTTSDCLLTHLSLGKQCRFAEFVIQWIY